MLNNIERFRFYAHKVLPLVYDDSLSYYEFLCKVVAKLNEVITLADEQNDVIEGIQEEVADFEAESDAKYQEFTQSIEEMIEQFEQTMTTRQEEFETDMSSAWSDFLEEYQRTFGIENAWGTSTTNAISQGKISNLIDYTEGSDTGKVKASALPIDDTATDEGHVWSASKIVTEIGALEDSIDTVDGNVDNLATELRGDISDINDDIAGIQSDLTDVETTVEGMESSLIDLSGSVTRLNGRVGDVESDMTEVQGIVANCEQDVEDMQTLVTQLDGDVDTLQTSVGTLTSSVEALESDVGDIEDELGSLDSRLDTEEGKTATLESTVATLGTSIDTLDGRIDGVNERLGTAETDINNLEDDMSSAEADIANNTQRISTAEGKIETLEGEMDTAQSDIEDIQDDIDDIKADIVVLENNKAEKIGPAPDLVSGATMQILATKKYEDTLPFVLRTTANNVDVWKYYKRKNLTGGSLVWNQLCTARATHTTNGVTVTKNDDGSVTLNGTANATGSLQTHEVNTAIIAGHKYGIFISSSAFFTGSEGYTNLGGSSAISSRSIVKEGTTSSSAQVSIRCNEGTVYNNVKVFIMIIDLSIAFGTTFENAIYSMNDHGIAWLYATFPELNDGFIPYSVAHFEHSKYKGVTSNGVNQFNGQTAEGYFNTTTGAFVSENRYICTDDLFKCLPDTTYYLKFKANTSLYLLFYDINKNFILTYSQVIGNTTFTTPSNAYYITWWQSKANYGSQTYQNDVGFYIHYDSSYDDIHEDYESWYTDLGSDVLKGIAVADDYTGSNVWSGNWHWEGDTKTPDGAITRNYKEYILDGNISESDIALNAYSEYGYTRIAYLPYSSEGVANVPFLSDRFIFAQNSDPNSVAGECKNSTSNPRMYLLLPSTVTTKAEAIAWFTNNPTTVLAPLATPTTEQGTAYEENEQCHNWGIQYVEDAEYDDGNRAFKMPMGGLSIYELNLKEKLESILDIPPYDGTYMLKVEGNNIEYEPFNFPALPTENGDYTLSCTVSQGVVTYQWKANE